MSSDFNARGLTQQEALRRLHRDGPNALPNQGPRTLRNIVLDVLREPMFLLLIAAAVVYVVFGDGREASVLFCSTFVVIAITALQERRTERALTRLKDLSSPRALVIRDGVEQRIAGHNVVVGDLIILREGDRVPADGVLLSATALAIDESILTGESLPVDKLAGDATSDAAKVYSGSLVVHGYGMAQVLMTGARSELGKIGRSLTTLSTEVTPLFSEVRRMVRWVAGGGLLLCAGIAVGYAVIRNDWLGGLLAGITVAMSVLPEEFPVVLTVFLAMGAWRISRVGVLTRRMPAVETIGAVTILAVDKTGTLTENRMRVAMLDTLQAQFDLRQSSIALDHSAERLLHTALAASEREPFDPMERAIHQAAQQYITTLADRLAATTLAREYELTPELLAVTHVWRESEAAYHVTAKGAPETMLDLCGVDNETRAALLQRVSAYAQDGLRVLGVAVCGFSGELPESPREFALQLLGFVCLADPLRHDVPAALIECKQAGIRVVMITGDHPGTALAIGAQAGLDTTGGVLTGAELNALDAEGLREKARCINIYARFKPEQKLRLVQAFKANGEIIAMTGDGVNDAPALKSAHVGVAMGARGTDVAREAAALILVNDDFASLVAAVRLGRRIYDNIRHAMSYIVAVHIPIAGLGLVPVMFGWPLLFFPLHVLFLEFVIDPACAFVFEADTASQDIMQRAPRDPKKSLFSSAMLRRSILLGTVTLLLEAAIYGVSLTLMSEHSARALTFVAVVVANLALIFVSRSHSRSLSTIYAKTNHVFWWITAATCAALMLVICVPSLAALFKFSMPSPVAIASVTVLSLGSVLLTGLVSTGRARPFL